jgi:hypothetical protein
MLQKPDITYYVGEEAVSFQEDTAGLSVLQRHAIAANYDHANVWFPALRERLEVFLNSKGFEQTFFNDFIYPGNWTRDKELKHTIEKIKYEIAFGQSVIATQVQDSRERIVGMATYKIGGKTKSGENVYEIGRASVLPSVRGKRIYSEIRSRCYNLALADHKLQENNLKWVTSTKNPTIKKMVSDRGMREISFDDYLALGERANSGWSEEMINRAENTRGGNPWSAYTNYDLKTDQLYPS